MNPNRLPTWREMNRDTTPETEEIIFDFWRTAPAWKKMALLNQMNRAARELALTGLRRRHPNASPEELHRLLADLLLGSDLAATAFGPLPAKHD